MMTGFFFIQLHLCMFGLRHTVTGEPVKKGLLLLTNAPWIIPLGVKCDGSHKHTRLQGHYTTLTAQGARRVQENSHEHGLRGDADQPVGGSPRPTKLVRP